MVSRAGANVPHGGLFDYLRNNYFDANNWFNDRLGAPTAPLRQNDFGGTFGGPVWLPHLYNGRDKTFFFVSYEGLRLTQPQAASILYVPDTALRANAATVLQPILNTFPLPNGPEQEVPCTLGLTSNYPCPAGTSTGTLVASGLADFSKPYALPASIDSTSIRLDNTFSEKLHVFFRYGYTPSETTSRVLANKQTTSTNSTTYAVGVTSQFSRTVSNEFRLGYVDGNSAIVYSLDSFGDAVPISLTSQFGIPGTYSDPEATFYFIFSGVGNSYVDTGSSSTGVRSWNLIDTVNIQLGRHQLKLGVDYNRLKNLPQATTPLVQALYYSPGSVENNAATSLDIEQNLNANPVFRNTAAFIQDEWRLKPRLSLSVGVRWDVDPSPHSANRNDAYTLFGSLNDPSTLSLAPRGTTLWRTYWFNLAPRAGAAWILRERPGKESVLRAGAGTFFDSYNAVGALGFNALGTSGVQAVSSGALPVTAEQLNFTPTATVPYSNVFAFPEHLQLPYTLQWNVSLEQALGKSQTLTVTYVGSNGRRLISTQAVSLSSLNPNFGVVYEFPGGITSNYQGLQTKFQRSVSHGIQALASYTWSHAIDFGSNYQTYGVRRGDSDFDVRQNFTAGASWDLPSPQSKGRSKIVLGGWGADGRFTIRGGFPVTLSGNTLIDPTTGAAYYSGVNLVPDKPLYLYGPQYPGGRALNGGPRVPLGTAAFTLPSGMSEGNAPRNLVRGFGENQLNFAARREFRFKEPVSLQFRAEAFNILNHPNFGLINATLTNAQFGLATQTLNQSLGTMAPQYQQGGPRSMQFALRIKF